MEQIYSNFKVTKMDNKDFSTSILLEVSYDAFNTCESTYLPVDWLSPFDIKRLFSGNEYDAKEALTEVLHCARRQEDILNELLK